MKLGRQEAHIKRFIGRQRYRPTKSPNVRPANTMTKVISKIACRTCALVIQRDINN